MLKQIREKYYNKWAILHGLVFSLMLIMVTVQVFFPQLNYISHFFFSRYALVLAVAAYLLFAGFRGSKIEVKLLFAYAVWYLLTRIMYLGFHVSGDELFEFYMLLFNAMFLAAGIILPAEKRKKLLDIAVSIVSILYSVMAVLAIYVYITRDVILIPGTEIELAYTAGNRAYILDNNPNVIGCWFMFAALFSIYMLIKYRKALMRSISAVILIINYFGITASGSRSCKLGFSVALAIILSMFVLKKLKNKSKAAVASAIVIVSVLTLPVGFMSFNAAAAAAEKIAEISINSEPIETSPDLESKGMDTMGIKPQAVECSANSTALPENQITADISQFKDKRGLADSGRIPIYKSAFYTLWKDPSRLLRGSLYENIMVISDEYTSADANMELHYSSFHNSFINCLIHTGVIGFCIMLSFCILLVRRMLLVFFSEDKKADCALKAMTAILAAILVYNMFETNIFYNSNERSLLFFITAGVFLGCSYDVIPGKSKTADK